MRIIHWLYELIPSASQKSILYDINNKCWSRRRKIGVHLAVVDCRRRSLQSASNNSFETNVFVLHVVYKSAHSWSPLNGWSEHKSWDAISGFLKLKVLEYVCCSELYSRSKLISSSQIRSDILMNLKKRSRSSSQAYLTLIFPSSSQWSDVNLSSWSDQGWCSAPY